MAGFEISDSDVTARINERPIRQSRFEIYRTLHRATKLTDRPLLSRQAVHVMGIDQSFSNAKARELLGWEPRVDYSAGLAATLDWLRAEGV